MSALTSYVSAWREYRILRLAALISLLALFPFLAAITFLFRRMHWNEYVGIALDAAYFLAMAFIGIRYATWRCPRCGKSYRGLKPYTGSLCYYCKLPKWAMSD